jgi:hypothetical protein
MTPARKRKIQENEKFYFLSLLQSKSLLGTSENIYLGGVVTLLYMAYTADGTKGHSCSSLLYAPQRQQ